MQLYEEELDRAERYVDPNEFDEVVWEAERADADRDALQMKFERWEAERLDREFRDNTGEFNYD